MPGKKKREEQEKEERMSRAPLPRRNQVIGLVDQLLGAKRMYVDCADGKRRLCRVPGRAKRRVWVREGDFVLVEPWSIQGDERGDVVYKYKYYQVDILRKRGLLKELE
ncbi:MAG: translation initiation factor eIF-1A [Candidatus Diapherotrites archaeon]|nr:translation initiation factor eIF-1A [Candidatus Diapherotrites archaeon]